MYVKNVVLKAPGYSTRLSFFGEVRSNKSYAKNNCSVHIFKLKNYIHRTMLVIDSANL